MTQRYHNDLLCLLPLLFNQTTLTEKSILQQIELFQQIFSSITSRLIADILDTPQVIFDEIR